MALTAVALSAGVILRPLRRRNYQYLVAAVVHVAGCTDILSLVEAVDTSDHHSQPHAADHFWLQVVSIPFNLSAFGDYFGDQKDNIYDFYCNYNDLT